LADCNLKPELIGPLIDAIAFSMDSRLDGLMEELDGIRKEVESGRSILISVNAYSEAVR
jgi:hypothetical protein